MATGCKFLSLTDSNTLEAFLSSLNFAEEYLQRFKDTGFDDMELIKSLNAEEMQQMFELVGLSKKLGHLLKFKKGLCSIVETPSTIPNISLSPVEISRDKATATTPQTTSFKNQRRKTQTSKGSLFNIQSFIIVIIHVNMWKGFNSYVCSCILREPIFKFTPRSI